MCSALPKVENKRVRDVLIAGGWYARKLFLK
jgi:hypothetical protein